MKETSFIKQNKKKWARFEKLAGTKNNDPDEVSSLFTEITEDLSYARTFYPRRSVRVYLNQLAQGVFTSLYKQRKQPIGNIWKFWTETIPLQVYRARYNLLTSFLFFFLAMVVGAISQEIYPDFSNLVLGDQYVNDTIHRIEDGNPMGIYGEMGETGMFLQITLNNIQVAFLTFVLGFFASFGTYVFLLNNGIMLGAFQWWFKMKGLLVTSFLAIWIHGAFEISSIVVAGAAGLTVGNGILFPGSYTRVQSMIFAAKRGLTIMFSLVPFFIIAGFLEGFVTRHYAGMHDMLKWVIIIFSFAVMVFYYVVFPFIVARKHPNKIAVKEVPRHIPERKIEWHKIRKVGEVFTDTFFKFMKHFGQFSRIFFVLIFPACIGISIYVHNVDHYNLSYQNSFSESIAVLMGFGRYFAWVKFVSWTLIFSLLISSTYFTLKHGKVENLIILKMFKYTSYRILWVWMAVMLYYGLIYLAFYSDNEFYNFLLVGLFSLLTPFILRIPAIILLQKKDFFTALIKSFELGKGLFGDGIGVFALFLGFAFVTSFLLHSPIFSNMDIISLVDEVLKNFTITIFEKYDVFISFINSIFYIMFFFIFITLIFIGFVFVNYSSIEINTAKGLYKRLDHFGKRNKQFETDVDYD
ncbi:stage II sporulation protein M [Paracrocinitomix mangrovi]|uniref:stage II sporulation protein M n=1 Tax=Paracrocinitomix mangrovi TaxID=2862509 RepID=UPI001C8DF7F5|nr:stage II sporulation protein M [Paracrocinitomix mangrovi]UKN00435.1 stage II sporulation protein M [Paracrocinitomix mangrovi]